MCCTATQKFQGNDPENFGNSEPGGLCPEYIFRELTRKGSCIIGLVLGYSCIHGIPSLRDTFVAEFLSGVEETAHRNGYYVMLINGQDKNTDRVAEISSRWNVDGLVVLGLDEKKYASCAGNSTNIWS